MDEPFAAFGADLFDVIAVRKSRKDPNIEKNDVRSTPFFPLSVLLSLTGV